MYRCGVEKLLSIVFVIFLFSSCGDKSDLKPVMSYLAGGYESASIYDPSLELKFGVYPGEDGCYVFLLRDEQIEKEVFLPGYKATVDLGYGEVKNVTYKVLGGIFMRDKIIVLQSYENKSNLYYVNIFDYNLNKIAEVDIKNPDANSIIFSRWGGDAFLVAQYLDNDNTKVDIYDDSARLVSSKEYPRGVSVPDLFSHILVNGYEEYVHCDIQEIFKQKLGEMHSQWRINWTELIKNKPEGESNPPKLDILKCVMEGTNVIVDMNVTYYNGDKESIHIKIDYESGNATIK